MARAATVLIAHPLAPVVADPALPVALVHARGLAVIAHVVCPVIHVLVVVRFARVRARESPLHSARAVAIVAQVRREVVLIARIQGSGITGTVRVLALHHAAVGTI